MATVKAIARTTKKSAEVNIRFRLSDGRSVQLFHNSEFRVNIDDWDKKKDCIKAKAIYTGDKVKFDNNINIRKNLLLEIYRANKEKGLTSDTFEQLIDESLHPEKYLDQKRKLSMFEQMEGYLQKKQLSYDQTKGFRVLIRILNRYEMYVRMTEPKRKDFTLDIETIDKDILEDIESYIRNEKSLADESPELFKKLLDQYPSCINVKRKTNKIEDRGSNTVIKLMKKLKVFFNWLYAKKITKNKPFELVTVGSETYGTPYYITLEERNLIAEFDLSARPQLAIQRDIFIFQCLIGCRVSDLLRMTQRDVINEAIEYIPNKTKDERPLVVRVPLNDRSSDLIQRYKGVDRKGGLFPFISAQKYNEAIKEVFTVVGITRLVTVINPTTGEEEKRPINELASSHMARRTFVGNLYKKVQDPNLIGKLSGHKEGSRAFARYRDIDDEIKKELVKLIE